MTPAKLYTADEVAERLRVHVKTIRRWIRQGLLGHVRVGPGRLVRISEDHVAAFLTADAAPAESATPQQATSFRDRVRTRDGSHDPA